MELPRTLLVRLEQRIEGLLDDSSGTSVQSDAGLQALVAMVLAQQLGPDQARGLAIRYGGGASAASCKSLSSSWRGMPGRPALRHCW